MRKFLIYIALIFIPLTSFNVNADSFYLDKDGTKYLCEEVGGSGGSSGSCWDKCPYGFTSCADSCGGGSACWDKCPYGFTSCADSCGGGSSCWEKCPYGFSSCADSCGNKGLTPNVLTRILNSSQQRMAFEKKHPQLK